MPAIDRKKVRDAAGNKPELAPLPPSLQRAAQYVIFAVIILGPLAVTQPGTVFYNTLDTTRRLCLFLGAGLLAAMVLRAWALRRRVTLRWHRLDIAVLLYLAGAVISSIGGAYPATSFFGSLWTQDGLLLLWMSVCLYFGIKEFLITPEDYERGTTWVGVVGGVVALIGLFDRFIIPHFGVQHGLNPSFSGTRLVATLGNPMFTGTYLAMTLPVAVGAALATANLRRRLLLAASAVLMLPAWLFCMSRSAWLGLALTVPFILLLVTLQWRRRRTDDFRNVALAIAAGIALVIFALGLYLSIGAASPLKTRLLSIAKRNDADTVNTRIVYMAGAFNIFCRYPIQGVGYGNIKAVFPQFRPASTVLESGLPLNRGYCTSLPHDFILQVAAESGLLGLIPYLLMAVLIYLAGVQLLRGSPAQAWLAIGLLGGVTAYFITNLSCFDNAATMAQFWTFAALLAGMGAVEHTLPTRYGTLSRPLNGQSVSLANIACLVIGLWTIFTFGLQAICASTFQQATTNIERASGMFDDLSSAHSQDKTKIRQAFALFDSGLNAMKSVARNSLVPQEAVFYEVLFVEFRQRLARTGSSSEIPRLQQEIADAAKMALKLNERDPIVLRYTILDNIRDGKYESALALASKLAQYEPRSAEVHVLYAQALQKHDQVADHDLEHAQVEIEKAIELDATLPDSFGLAGQIYFALASRDPRQTMVYMRKSVDDYDRVYQLGAGLIGRDQLYFAMGLFGTGDTKRAIVEGRKMQGKPEFTELCEQIININKQIGKPDEGARIVKALQASAPPAASPTAQELSLPGLTGQP